jgi:alkylmercury lyase
MLCGTPHVFEIDGCRLYTWCALEALMFPALIGKTAHVLSRRAATGVPVSLTFTPGEARKVNKARIKWVIINTS